MKKLFFCKEKNRHRDSAGTNSRSRAISNSSSNENVAAIDTNIVNRTPQPDIHENSQSSGNSTAINNSMIDAYELRIEELGHLMVEQGRHLDELSNRSRQLSSENIMLRERMATGLENLTQPTCITQSKSPLKNIINYQKKGSVDDQVKAAQKCKEENSLLRQQADLMLEELGITNRRISELDMTVASLEKELKMSWENNYKCMYCMIYFRSSLSLGLSLSLSNILQ